MSKNNTYDGSNPSHIEMFEKEDIMLFNSDETNDYENDEDDEENEETLAYG